MKRKNLMTLLLALTLVSSSLAGCSSGSAQTTPEADTTAVSGTPAQETSVQETSIPETSTDTGSDTQAAQAPIYPLPDAAEDAGIYVEPIPDISDDIVSTAVPISVCVIRIIPDTDARVIYAGLCHGGKYVLFHTVSAVVFHAALLLDKDGGHVHSADKIV